MKISYNWLKEYVDLDISPENLAEKMTFGGIEVESVEKLGEHLGQIIVARVVSKNKHPQADKLSVCEVDDGKQVLQVICGAPNCKAGIKVAFAPVGSKLGEYKIKKVKLRGIESYGMICSEKELEISDDHEGIMILPDDAPVGKDLASYLDLEDTVYEVEITPNRSDLLGIMGIARDVAAILGKELKPPPIDLVETDEKITENLELENQAPDLCPRYTARMIKNVRIKESPSWLKKHLISVGLRPINNVVDVTNFVMMEYGHPLHAFDYSLIKGRKIIVRRARDREKFRALDEETYPLNREDLVIADSDRAIALAGVIGGENSQIESTTTDVVIEAANFLYSTIRKTASRLGIVTDSSYRFERDISDATADEVSRRACQLILDLAGGELLHGVLDSYPSPDREITVPLRLARLNKLLRLELNEDQVIGYLTALKLAYVKTEADTLYFSIPHFRKDLTREIDLVEEVIRLHGYNNVGSFLSTQNIMNRQRFYARRRIKSELVHLGFSELVNWNFGDPGALDRLEISDDDPRRDFVRLRNPLGTSFSVMRSMLLPDLLTNTHYNINHGQKDFKIFEMAKVFTRDNRKLAREDLHLTALLTGKYQPVYWQESQREVDFFDVKGVVEGLLRILGHNDPDFKPSCEPYYQQGIGADVHSVGTKVATLGKLDPKIAAEFGLEVPLYIFDLGLEKLLEISEFPVPEFRPIPKFPPVLRDLSFIVAKDIDLSRINDTISGVNKDIIRDVILYDQYEGKNIKSGYRSLTFKIIFNSHTKTLTDEFINDIVSKVIAELEKNYTIEMR